MKRYGYRPDEDDEYEIVQPEQRSWYESGYFPFVGARSSAVWDYLPYVLTTKGWKQRKPWR